MFDFEIDLTIIAAFLTIVGYSLNDTIVIFDRVRENVKSIKWVWPHTLEDSLLSTYKNRLDLRIKENNITKIDKEKAKGILEQISKEEAIKKGIIMKSLRVAFFGCLNGPDLIQSWELLSENNSDISRIERCFMSA